MTDRVSRADLLAVLEAVQPGLSPSGALEQSACFVFRNGWAITFNDEVSVRAKTPLPTEVVGAVPGEPLLKVLRHMPEDEVAVAVGDGELRLTGQRRRAGIRMEADVTLPVAAVERPGQWLPLADDFLDAVKMVQECASKNQNTFSITCVHLTPEFVEATDSYQMTRYTLPTRFSESVLVRSKSLRHVVTLGVTEFSEGNEWVHFRNPSGLVISCRRWVDEYLDLTPALAFRGSRTALPKGLAEATKLAGIFSGEDADDDQVLVEIRPGKVRVRGDGTSGWADQTAKLSYTGKPLSFRIPPTLLAAVVEKHNQCEVSDTKLRVDGGNWQYVTVLGVLGDNNGQAQPADTEADSPEEEA